MSIAVEIIGFFLVVLGVINVSATCESPQYAEYGQQGVIKCNFMPGFTGVFWYLSVNSRYQIVIRLEQQDGILVRSGDGYSEGKYDIHSDGSLVISNITDYNNQSFKVVHVDKELLVEELYVELLTAIFPDPKFPLINLCNKNNLCLMEKIDSGVLTCSYNRSKPPVELVWYRQSHESTYRLEGKTMVTKDGDWTFTSVLTTNISNYINGPLIAFSCHVANPVLSLQDVKSSVVVDTTKQAWPLLLENVKKETYFEIDSTAEVPCNGKNKLMIFVWEKLWRTTTDILMFAIKQRERVFYNVDSKWNISYDGSLVFPNISFENEGLFTCTYFDGTRYVSNMIQVNVLVKPTPPFIFTNECPQEEETCEVTVKDKNSPFNISCHLNGVYPNVTLAIETDSPSENQIFRRNTYSVRRGNVYDITAVAELSPIDCYNLINVTCYLPNALPLIGRKVISVRLEECGAGRSSAVAAVITVIIVIIILIICATLLFRFRKRFFPRTDTEKAIDPEEVPFRENQGTAEAMEPTKADSSHSESFTPVQHCEEVTDTLLKPAKADSSHSESFTLVENCKEIADTLLLWPVNGITEVFKEQALAALKDINDKRQTNQNKGEAKESVPSFLDIFYSYVWDTWWFKPFSSLFSSGEGNQTKKEGSKDQQLFADQLKRTLHTYVQLQEALLQVTTSVALCYDIIRSMSKNSNFSDDKYSDEESEGIEPFLQSLKNEIKDEQDLLKILSSVNGHIRHFLPFLQTLFLDKEKKERITATENISLEGLPSAIVTLFKEREGTDDGINIFNFVTKFYAQSVSQEDVDVTTLNIKECEEKIKNNIKRIAEGVSAASMNLSSFGEKVNTDFLGTLKSSVDQNEEHTFQRNVAMIENMKKMNSIARSMKSLT